MSDGAVTDHPIARRRLGACRTGHRTGAEAHHHRFTCPHGEFQWVFGCVAQAWHAQILTTKHERASGAAESRNIGAIACGPWVDHGVAIVADDAQARSLSVGRFVVAEQLRNVGDERTAANTSQKQRRNERPEKISHDTLSEAGVPYRQCPATLVAAATPSLADMAQTLAHIDIHADDGHRLGRLLIQIQAFTQSSPAGYALPCVGDSPTPSARPMKRRVLRHCKQLGVPYSRDRTTAIAISAWIAAAAAAGSAARRIGRPTTIASAPSVKACATPTVRC